MDILNRILQSRFTTIGYDSKSELSLIKLLNLIPNRIQFGIDEIIKVDEIEEFFNSVSYNRNHKLSYLLDDEKEQFIVINFSSIDFDNKYPLNKSKSISDLVRYLQSTIYTLNNTDSSVNYSLILLAHTYVNNVNQNLSIAGGESLIFNSELYLRLTDGNLIIEKDRYSNLVGSTNLTSELRKLSINHILNENT
jgi:hypothetical protein